MRESQVPEHRQQTTAAEHVFRRANANLEETYRALVPSVSRASFLPFICECSDARCTSVIRLTLEEYEAVRAEIEHFAVVPGHLVVGFAHVVEENERYAVLVKDGDRQVTNIY